MPRISVPEPVRNLLNARLGADIFEDCWVDVSGIPLRPTVIRSAELSVMGSSCRRQEPAQVNDSLLILHQLTIPF